MDEQENFDESIFERVRRQMGGISHPDAAYLREDAVMKLKSFIELHKTEQEINDVIKGNTDLLVSLLDIFNTGHHGSLAIPEAQIRSHIRNFGKGLIPDWLLMGENSDGRQYYFIELKKPSDKIFVNKGNFICFSTCCNAALNQLLTYIKYAERNQSYFRDEFDFGDFSNPKGVLVIGNRNDLDEEMKRQKKAWNVLLSNKIEIITWDRVLTSLMQKWEFVKG